jgi:hypothetical protein
MAVARKTVAMPSSRFRTTIEAVISKLLRIISLYKYRVIGLRGDSVIHPNSCIGCPLSLRALECKLLAPYAHSNGSSCPIHAARSPCQLERVQNLTSVQSQAPYGQTDSSLAPGLFVFHPSAPLKEQEFISAERLVFRVS